MGRGCRQKAGVRKEEDQPSVCTPECLKLSKSSYIYQKAVLDGPDKYQSLRQELKDAVAAVNGYYGYRRLHAALKGLGRSVSENVVCRLMKEEHLVVRNIRRRRYYSYLGEIGLAVPNLVAQNFRVGKPNEKWLTDIYGIQYSRRESVPLTDH